MLFRLYYTYIMASKSRVLYVGVTNNLGLRVAQHRSGLDLESFTTHYRVYQLVYFEECPSVKQAIAREKQIKGWTRAKKLALVDRFNPEWRDLAPHVIPSREDGEESGRG